MGYLRHEDKEADQNDYSSVNPHSGSEDCCQYLSAGSVRRANIWM